MSKNEASMSFATKKQEVVSIAKAKDELKNFIEEREKGYEFMNKTREPFCGACYWQEWQKRRAVWEFQKSQGGVSNSEIELPSWEEYAGKDKFVFVKKDERRNRREMSIDVEERYECKKNPRHSVTISDSKPMYPEMVEHQLLVKSKDVK